MLGGLGGEMLSIPRILYAGARDGVMPKLLAKIHPRFFTPYISIIFYASLGLLFAISGSFKQLAVIASAASLVIYLGVVLATLKLRKTTQTAAEKTFRIPGGIIVPLLAIGTIIWLLSSLTKPELMGMAIFIVVFTLIFFVVKFMRRTV